MDIRGSGSKPIKVFLSRFYDLLSLLGAPLGMGRQTVVYIPI